MVITRRLQGGRALECIVYRPLDKSFIAAACFPMAAINIATSRPAMANLA